MIAEIREALGDLCERDEDIPEVVRRLVQFAESHSCDTQSIVSGPCDEED